MTLGGSISEDGQTAATIIHKYQGTRSNADIYLHNPPVPPEEVEVSSREPDIRVLGDMDKYSYDFMMGPLDQKPVKIAQVDYP